MNMEITYLGHSSFKLRGKKMTVVTDPFDPKYVGLAWPRVSADLITVSHHHKDHDYIKGVSGTTKTAKPKVIDVPGEFEINEVGVLGVTGSHGEGRGEVVMFNISIDGVNVLHLGDLAKKLTDRQIEKLGRVEVLLLPVGGKYTLGPRGAIEVISQLEPNWVVPMHYQTEGLKFNGELKSLDSFIQATGKEPQKQEKLVAEVSRLPENWELVCL
jgi:L-ascorbate metabolism protein UlaG (beta-lactamase superfamily)